MKKSNWLLSTIILVIALAMLFFIISCQKQDVEADIAAITELYDQYCLGANTGDLDLFISCWADDAIRLEPDHSSIFGKEDIRAFFKAAFEPFNIKITIYGDTEIQVTKDMAFGRGTAMLLFTPKEGGPTIHMDAKWLDILKRQADGSWKIYRDMVNYNAPPKVE
jgi:uncharacterized protein (TIGR02246 family)